MNLLVNEEKLTGAWARNCDTIQQVLILKFAFGRGGSRIFFRRGCTRLLLYFNTNKPQSFFFLQNTNCIRKPQVISGEGAHPLHPPPRSAPVRARKVSGSFEKRTLGRLLQRAR